MAGRGGKCMRTVWHFFPHLFYYQDAWPPPGASPTFPLHFQAVGRAASLCASRGSSPLELFVLWRWDLHLQKHTAGELTA